MSNLNEIAQQISNLNPSQALDLLNIFKEDYGIEPNSGPVTMSTTEVEVETESKTEFDVILESAGTGKLSVVKLVKSLTSLGLIESKQLVDSAPVALREKVSEQEAKTLKTELEAAGAVVTIK